MARLYLTPGSQTYGPIPGGALTQAFGSNQAEKVKLAVDANVTFDPSFVRGNDTLVILGNTAVFAISANVVGVTLVSEAGATIRIPAFGNDGGITLEFSNSTLELITTDGGISFILSGGPGSNQLVTDTSQPVFVTGTSAFVGVGAEALTSIDVGTDAAAQTLDAGLRDLALVDDAEATTNVVITNFGSGDRIFVTNASSGDYAFARDAADSHDLLMSYTDPGTGATNTIVFDDVLPDTGVVNSYASATDAMGFAFLTFA